MPLKNTDNMVEYLSRYTHKTAICNNRLVSMAEKIKLASRELILKAFGLDISVCPHCGGTWSRCKILLPAAG